MKEKKNCTFIWTEKKIVLRGKNPDPPLVMKWEAPYLYGYGYYCISASHKVSGHDHSRHKRRVVSTNLIVFVLWDNLVGMYVIQFIIWMHVVVKHSMDKVYIATDPYTPGYIPPVC